MKSLIVMIVAQLAALVGPDVLVYPFLKSGEYQGHGREPIGSGLSLPPANWSNGWHELMFGQHEFDLPDKHGTGKHGAGKHGAGKHGAGKHGAGKHGAGKHGAGKHGAGTLFPSGKLILYLLPEIHTTSPRMYVCLPLYSTTGLPLIGYHFMCVAAVLLYTNLARCTKSFLSNLGVVTSCH